MESRKRKAEAPRLEVIYRATAELLPYAKNARTHTASQVAQIVASINEFGWTNPVLIDESGGIIAGHGRVMAAKKLGLAEVATITLAGLTEAQRRAYIIADNKLALNAGWDLEILSRELLDIGSMDIDLNLTGFSLDEMTGIHARAGAGLGLTEEDDVPEAPVNPVSRLGDLWCLGKHRLICGDSTDAATVQRLLDGEAPHLMVTDPPYGVEYDAEWRNKAMRSNGSPISGSAVGKVRNDDRADWSAAWKLFPGAVAYVWHAGNKANIVADSLQVVELEIRAQVIWAKSQLVIGRGHYHPQHEPCWYAVRKGATGHWNGDRKQTTLWEIDKPQKSETGHSTQKPVECMRRPMINNSAAGDAVYEPFSGSGTSIIAAQDCGRICYAVELNPAYIDVAVLRWQEFTGQVATLEDGRTFAQIAAERVAAP